MKGTYTAEGITALSEALKVTALLTRLDVGLNDLGEESKAVLRGAVAGRSGFELSPAQRRFASHALHHILRLEVTCTPNQVDHVVLRMQIVEWCELHVSPMAMALHGREATRVPQGEDACGQNLLDPHVCSAIQPAAAI